LKHCRMFLLVVILSLAHADAGARKTKQVWIATWGAAQQIPEPQNALAAEDLRDAVVDVWILRDTPAFSKNNRRLLYEHVSFGDLPRQIADVPNGGKVRLKVGEPPSGR